MAITVKKVGDTSRLTADRDFTCYLCGAEFTATSDDFQIADYYETGSYNVESMCKCPTCGHMTYRFRNPV